MCTLDKGMLKAKQMENFSEYKCPKLILGTVSMLLKMLYNIENIFKSIQFYYKYSIIQHKTSIDILYFEYMSKYK